MTAHGTAIQNASVLILVTLTARAFLALIGTFLMPVFWRPTDGGRSRGVEHRLTAAEP